MVRFGELSVHLITDGALLAVAGACPDVAKTACKNLDNFSKGDILTSRETRSAEMLVRMMRVVL